MPRHVEPRDAAGRLVFHLHRLQRVEAEIRRHERIIDRLVRLHARVRGCVARLGGEGKCCKI